jgi:biopolymer transport protein ExbB
MNVAFLNAWGVLLKGGAMMWPILLLSITALTIAVEKFIHLNEARRSMYTFKDQVLQVIRTSDFKEAVRICETTKSFLGDVLKTGILKYGSSRAVLFEAMEEKASFEIHRLKQRLDVLVLITNAAPLLGLLGTISGMAVVFNVVQIRSNALNPLSLGDMSSGIWQALLTTIAGLIVGIIALAAHSYCAWKVNDLIIRVEMLLGESADLLQGLASLEVESQEEA